MTWPLSKIRKMMQSFIYEKTRVFGLSVMIQPWTVHVLITVSCEYLYL